MEKYVLVMWPESQALFEQPWFDDCVLAMSIESSAYFVPENRYNELYGDKVKVLITVKGGMVTSVGSNSNIERCIIDYDVEDDDRKVTISSQDYTMEFFYDEFSNVSEQVIHDQLKEANF